MNAGVAAPGEDDAAIDAIGARVLPALHQAETDTGK